MATRIVAGGRTVWADREWWSEYSRPKASRALPRDREGMPVDVAPIAPDDPRSPFRAGVTFYDPDEEVYYRCVDRLDPREGWATSEFWQDRWKLSHEQVIKLARSGLIDAAFTRGSQVRKYRCRDEAVVVRSDLMRAWYRRRARGQWLKLLRA